MERMIAKKKKKSLTTKHQNIDLQIKKKSKILSLDNLEINSLKKRKLFIKDKIYSLKIIFSLYFLYFSMMSSISVFVHKPSS